jgi:hypothetical protein
MSPDIEANQVLGDLAALEALAGREHAGVESEFSMPPDSRVGVPR